MYYTLYIQLLGDERIKNVLHAIRWKTLIYCKRKQGYFKGKSPFGDISRKKFSFDRNFFWKYSMVSLPEYPISLFF